MLLSHFVNDDDDNGSCEIVVSLSGGVGDAGLVCNIWKHLRGNASDHELFLGSFYSLLRHHRSSMSHHNQIATVN